MPLYIVDVSLIVHRPLLPLGGVDKTEQDDQILVVTDLDIEAGSRPIERGPGRALAEGALRAVPVSVLKANMDRFFGQLREILASNGDDVGGFEVSEVEIAAKITGDGQISLMSSGVKVGFQGGMTFKLKRRPPRDTSS
jgi:hypothetical protein